MRVLLIEDEAKINALLTLYIKQDHHEVDSFTDAETALEAFQSKPYDLVISDLMLPKMQGESLIRTIRESSDVYVIVLTAKTSKDAKIQLLKEGVDDYLTKPFNLDEVLMKLKNIERRLDKEKTFKFRHENNAYVLKTKTNRLYKNGQLVNLNHREIVLLKYLIRHPYHILSREQIITNCFDSSDAFDRIIDTYIKNIRRKLDDKHLIETVYGVGYRFKGERDD